MVEAYHFAVAFVWGENVHSYGTDIFRQWHYQLFPISWWEDWSPAQIAAGSNCIVIAADPKYSERRIITHRTDRFCSGSSHRSDNFLDIFFGVMNTCSICSYLSTLCDTLRPLFSSSSSIRLVANQVQAVWHPPVVFQFVVVVYFSFSVSTNKLFPVAGGLFFISPVRNP